MAPRPRFPLREADRAKYEARVADALKEIAPGARVMKFDVTTPIDAQVGFYNWASGRVTAQLADGSTKTYRFDAGYRVDRLVPENAKPGERMVSWQWGTKRFVDPVLAGSGNTLREQARLDFEASLRGSWREAKRGEDSFTSGDSSMRWVAEPGGVVTASDAEALIASVRDSKKGLTAWGRVELQRVLAEAEVGAQFKDAYAQSDAADAATKVASQFGKLQLTPKAHAAIVRALGRS